MNKQILETNVMAKAYTHTYKPEEDKDTCKTDFIFELEEEVVKTIIRNLTLMKKKLYRP